MRGLPDSAIYGTYKRLARKKRRKAGSSFDEMDAYYLGLAIRNFFLRKTDKERETK